MLDDYWFNSTGKSAAKPLFTHFLSTVGSLRFLFSQWIKKYKYSGFLRRRPLIASYAYSIIFFVFWFIRERFLFSRFSNVFEKPVDGEPYVYFPLHLIPESTTLVKAPFYPNELFVLEAVSKSLPMGWKLYVKEHGAMIGERPLRFYTHLKRLSNVRLVEIGFYDDPKPWIVRSKGVVTLTGSSAFECVMLGKRSIIFGSAFFEVIDGVSRINSIEILPDEIRKLGNCDEMDQRSCASYLQAVTTLGEYVPLAEILVTSKKILEGTAGETPKFREDIRRIVSLLMRARERFECVG
jgi:hypothetical protein